MGGRWLEEGGELSQSSGGNRRGNCGSEQRNFPRSSSDKAAELGPELQSLCSNHWAAEPQAADLRDPTKAGGTAEPRGQDEKVLSPGTPGKAGALPLVPSAPLGGLGCVSVSRVWWLKWGRISKLPVLTTKADAGKLLQIMGLFAQEIEKAVHSCQSKHKR